MIGWRCCLSKALTAGGITDVNARSGRVAFARLFCANTSKSMGESTEKREPLVQNLGCNENIEIESDTSMETATKGVKIITKSNALHKRKRHYIEKRMFGNLLETANDRKKRIKVISEHSVATIKPMIKKDSVNSECFYMLKSATAKVIHIQKMGTVKKSNKIIKKKMNDTESMSAEVAQEVTEKQSGARVTADTVDLLTDSHVIKEITLYPICGKLPNSDVPLETDLLQNTLDNPDRYPSVTAILNETMAPEARRALERWKENMIEKLGQRGFEQYQAELLEDGKNLHSCIQNTLMRKEVLVEPKIELAYASLKNIFQDVDDVLAVERPVYHPKLKYKGIVDCIASYRGEQYIIDWKKSGKTKFTLTSAYDAPTQLAAYIGAVCASEEYPFPQVGKGLLVFAYTDGTPATTLNLTGVSLERYWKIWLNKLKQYHESPNRKYNVAKTVFSP